MTVWCIVEPWMHLVDTERQISFSGVEGGSGGAAMKRAVTSVRSAVQRLAAERAAATVTMGLGASGSFSLGASLEEGGSQGVGASLLAASHEGAADGEAFVATMDMVPASQAQFLVRSF